MDVQRTDELSARLRSAGLRVTGPRLAVLTALIDLGGHRGAEEVYETLRGRGQALARGSVYNALRDLTEAGVVLAADVGPGMALYEVGGAFHHHFVCRSCGTVLDVPCVVGARPCLQPAPPDHPHDHAAPHPPAHPPAQPAHQPAGQPDGGPVGQPAGGEVGIAEVDEAQVIFRGLCTRCSASGAPTPSGASATTPPPSAPHPPSGRHR